MTKFFKALIVLIGIGAAAFLLWEPQVEGVNAHATNTEIYFRDPLLAYVYISSILFFVILYQAFRLLGYGEQRKLFSPDSLRALRAIQYSAMTMVPLIVIGVIWILSQESDDRPPILAMGLVATLISIAVATVAGKYAKNVENAIDIQSKNDFAA